METVHVQVNVWRNVRFGGMDIPLHDIRSINFIDGELEIVMADHKR
jgi:hypothetical protein